MCTEEEAKMTSKRRKCSKSAKSAVMETSAGRDAMENVIVVCLYSTGRNALTTRQLICDRSHAEHSPPTTRQDRRTAGRQLTRQPYSSNRLRRRSSSSSSSSDDGGGGSGTVTALTDGILHAPALLAASRRKITRHRPTDEPACRPHSVVADRHGGGRQRSGRLDEIGSIVRRTDRTSATTATDGPLAARV